MQYNVSLKPYNTFGIEVFAKAFEKVYSEEDIINFIRKKPSNEALFVLNGGSNMLLTKNVNAWVMKLELKGLAVISETSSEVIIEAKSSENWHEFVLYCLANNWGGLENLSLIPGNVGSSPIQNIGAYGVEIKDTFVSLEAIHIPTLETHTFTNEECKFGYRESVFKNEFKNQYIITAVRFRLSKAPHKIHTTYGVINQELQKMGISSPTITDVSNAVIRIRQSKLPDPKEIGNSGSFFKNPVIDKKTFQEFQKQNPDAPFYEVSANEFKIPAGWLIEKSGLKGYRNGDAGVHTKQALVLVNYGNASGKEILEVAKHVQDTVFQNFKIHIQPEVNII